LDAPKGKVTITTFDMVVRTGGTITTTKASGQGPTTFCPAVFAILRADDANSATIKWGMGSSATDPLAKGETAAFDVPAGFYFDLSEICVNGTAADIIHVVAGIVENFNPLGA